jgi:cobyrinic acid a,c-diamide synthase
MVVDRENPYFAPGTVLRGHEFHYSRIVGGIDPANLVFSVRRGTGAGTGRGGLVRRNVLATWLHLHAAGTPDWATSLVTAARAHARRREEPGRETENPNVTGSITR